MEETRIAKVVEAFFDGLEFSAGIIGVIIPVLIIFVIAMILIPFPDKWDK